MAARTREARRSIRRRRRLRVAFRLNALVAIALCAVLLVMLNFLSYRQFKRWDVSRARFYKLSEKTLNLVGGLTNTVEITFLFSPDNGLFEDVKRLLAEYEYACEAIEAQHVDPHRDLGRTRELAATYDIEDQDVLIVAYGDKARVIPSRELVEAEYTEISQPMVPSRVDFLGEVVLSSTIKNLVQGRQPLVYFLQGHGERDIASFDEYDGYSDFAQAVRRDNIRLESLVLGERRAVPADADGLIIAAPVKKISQPELDILRDYLERSGRALLLLEPLRDAGLKPLLADWGTAIRDDLVWDHTRTLKGRELSVSEYRAHPITDSIQGITTVFYLPRSVQPLVSEDSAVDPADKPRVVTLIASSEAGWAESDLEQQPRRFDPAEDQPGPVGIAVAVERGPDPGLAVEIPTTRMVVVGDSDFVANGALSGGNADFALGALNWLLEREDMLAIEGKSFAQYRLTIERKQMRQLFLVVIAGLPGVMGVLGFVVWWIRRA